MIYITGIFILLFISMFFVLKYCKNKLKIFLSSIIVLITCYFVILSIDMNRISTLKKPIFMWNIESHSETLYMNGEAIYQGLGYRVYIEEKNNQIISTEMYMFDQVIAAAIT